MKYFTTLLLFISLSGFSQFRVSSKGNPNRVDTLGGYEQKITGEEISYYSPLHQFATTALLTRANGEMPISWQAPIYKGNKETVTYELLIGHSTGTSTGDRNFDVSLNGVKLFTITTIMKKKGSYTLSYYDKKNIGYTFVQQDFDVNGDAFGKLYLTVPANMATQKAAFTIKGQDEKSRDWLMVFMYKIGFKYIIQPTNLITRKDNKRQLIILIDSPFETNTPVKIKIDNLDTTVVLVNGFNKISVPAFDKNSTFGNNNFKTGLLLLNQVDSIPIRFQVTPFRDFTFYLIHHSHTDIGYSNLQSEVEQIQNNNITSAINWINNNKTGNNKAYWHIESLWAVENYLRIATSEQEANFVAAVKSGQLVLSANYANVLTGLCQQEELNWNLEYAKKLENKYGIAITSAMITDIPGITQQGLKSYIDNGIPNLSLGPNYVETQPDKGDRVGAVIRDQGDKIFYWKPDSTANKKLMVWTAGKGYSFFHGITDREKQEKYEQRIAQYCDELSTSNYPYDIIQLRYTKNSDNGPVDTLLCDFVKNWNERYSSPQLRITSVDTLFKNFALKYGDKIPTHTGEISPYWEDGAYSTAVEEMENRQLVLKTIALGKYAEQKNLYQQNEVQFYNLHRSIIMFHEHTWGSWCSISDPEIPFTTEQWAIKKQFLDSAIYYYNHLAASLSFKYQATSNTSEKSKKIDAIEIDNEHGGLKAVVVDGNNVNATSNAYGFLEPIYALGINPTTFQRAVVVGKPKINNSATTTTVTVNVALPSMKNFKISYTLSKETGKLTCKYSFDKTIEKDKESLHIAMPFNFNQPKIKYGIDDYMVTFQQDQLPGSNFEFVCVPEKLVLESANLSASISSPTLALYEIGKIVDENKTNGAKQWNNYKPETATVFLYVFNNYWHTNYKAYQDGHFEFEVDLSFQNNK